MQVLRALFSRYGRRRRVGTALAVPAALGILIGVMALLAGFLPGLPGGTALAELVARSPGMRIGGTALKSKSRRAEVMPATGIANNPGNAVASVLGSSLEPEVPASGALPDPDFPEDFQAPPMPTEPSGVLAEPLANFRLPTYGDVVFRGPAIVPPTLRPEIGTSPVPVAPIPEPQSWALLILGFGVVGSAMRTARCRVAVA